MEVTRIAVVGGGIGGFTSAALLASRVIKCNFLTRTRSRVDTVRRSNAAKRCCIPPCFVSARKTAYARWIPT